MIDRRLIYHFDGFALLLMMLIVALGVTTVYSATYQAGRAVADSYAWRHALWALFGLAAPLAMVAFDYRRLERYAWLFWGVGAVLLLAVDIAGEMGNGSRRWLAVGPVTVQPSALMKLALTCEL